MEIDAGLSLACSLTVLGIVSSSLVLLNVIQTLTLGALLSFVVWIKAITCSGELLVKKNRSLPQRFSDDI